VKVASDLRKVVVVVELVAVAVAAGRDEVEEEGMKLRGCRDLAREHWRLNCLESTSISLLGVEKDILSIS